MMKNTTKGYVDGFFLALVGITASIIALIVVAIVGIPGGLGAGYSIGARTGTVTKFSNKGMFMKSFEGELNMGGLKQSSDKNGKTTAVANIFEFSVTEPSIIKTIEEALDSGKSVKLSYTQYFVKPLGIETPYVITKAEVK